MPPRHLDYHTPPVPTGPRLHNRPTVLALLVIVPVLNVLLLRYAFSSGGTGWEDVATLFILGPVANGLTALSVLSATGVRKWLTPQARLRGDALAAIFIPVGGYALLAAMIVIGTVSR